MALVAGTQGCKAAGEDARECNVNADCASGTCNPDGYCAPAAPTDAAPQDALADSRDAATEEPADAPQEVEVDADPGVCQPNGDGTITANEIPLGPGFDAMFRVSKDVDPFDSRPDCTSGTCVWDLTNVGGVTTEELSQTESLEGKWYAGIEGFENATYTSRMSEFRLAVGGMTVCDQVQYGVFEVNQFGLFLLGIVSEFEDEGTALVQDEPVPVLTFPMSLGTTWKVDTTATGKLCGSWIDYNIDQTYTSEVDAEGSVLTPLGTHDNVLRVNTLIERHMGVGVTATKMVTHTYVAECYATIAVVTSPEGESGPELTAASEVRRLTQLP